MKIALAQSNTRVGAIDRNTDSLLATAARARDEFGASLVVFPELALSGYPPEDLLFHNAFRRSVSEAAARAIDEVRDITVCFGLPEYVGDKIYNSAIVARDGVILAKHRKWMLPNYAVFDEKRYFEAGSEATVFALEGIRFGLIVCEDVWFPEPTAAAAAAGAEVVLVINGSPYDNRQRATRRSKIRARALETGLPFIYLNMVGGQDELVFDGGSCAHDATGELVFQAPVFDEGLYLLEIESGPEGARILPQTLPEEPDPVAMVYQALKTGVRDYVEKNGFPGVILGLSGGVDSALTLAVAVDALGADRVMAVMMPSRYTSTMSLDDAAAEARRLGVRYEVLSIEPIFASVIDALAPVFEGMAPDTTEENIQARCRGILLMALSNKLGLMLLSTGNKSEMAVGYATLYGDMAGGFAPLKDCSKTMVYALARYRNGVSSVIPETVLTREPSAELAPDQKDSDSLPSYDVLDAILEAFIEKDQSVDEISARGFDRATVVRVLEMVKRAEYKRRQAPPGVRISRRAFGRDWRYPITSGY
ncbi:MAG TPA: NAD+ synthase [Gammaproteobacteria bacterium]|nr:NAD+ synthase [Gammaproteobacteria bacterium]